ncbi:hypothetical protein BGZ54_008614 [Gamsiella multidivaricata]|nr:hypothetical protein BGZ54_008614 [Gamsiella multidivaricata]
MEPSNSLQSLVESIDDDHVFKLTEMTKKRVEHNNPTQKRQRVVSLPATEASLAANFQPSEKTLQFSSSCKAYLESKYTQLYQSIDGGHSINRLRKLHEILPQLKTTSISKPASDSKTSMDAGQQRPRKLKSDKYRFVDKVEESSCIWDVDHMEAKAAAQAAAEAAALARRPAIASSRHGSQSNLVQTAPSILRNPSQSYLSSTSSESLAIESSLVMESKELSATTPNPPYHNPTTVGGGSNVPAAMSPLSHDIYNANGIEFSTMETSPSKRNSFLGIFGVRGKKVGPDIDHSIHGDSPQSSGYGSPRITATASTQERRSLDSQHSPYVQSAHTSTQGQRSQAITETASSSIATPHSGMAQGNVISDTQTKQRASLDEVARVEYGEGGGIALTDDENSGCWTPPSQWPQGERIDDSQDESDNQAAATYKRSSLLRLKDKMTWKRGQKALSAIQQGEPYQNTTPTIPVQGRASLFDISKSVGKKVDPSLAYLQGQNFTRTSTSEPSSSRNSMDNSVRPKLNIRVLSSSSSPGLDPVKSPDGVMVNSPRVVPSSGLSDVVNRTDKSPRVNPASRMERSPLLNPSRTEKSPLLPASTFAGEDIAGNAVLVHTDISKQAACVASQLLIDVERIPKRLLQRLKTRPELASIDWTADTVDLSALWTASEPPPTYEEHIGISDMMKSSSLYPSHLDEIDVLEIRLTLGVEEPKDHDAKSRARKWDLLELRVEQELDNGEKWIKEAMSWSRGKASAIERHQQAEIANSGAWNLDENTPLSEEPEAEEAPDESIPSTSLEASGGARFKHNQLSPLDAIKDRRTRRGLSVSSVRDLSGSMSSLHTSATYSFQASVQITREAVEEMRVYVRECRQRLEILKAASGAQLYEKEQFFKDVVDKFTVEWNESYFVKLKEVEDQIQMMNLKRIENPWMDMLLIMLSWFIRGLFYLVEGVTIVIIIMRNVWGHAKKGYGVVRKAKREQERLSHYNGGKVAETADRANGSESASAQNAKSQEEGKAVDVADSQEQGNGHVNGGVELVGEWAK